MTDLELIAVFAASWTLAAAIWMLLDWAARPKHARFRPKGDRIQRGPFAYRHFRKVRRAEENEEIRLRIEERYDRPTLAIRKKRQHRVLARHDRIAGDHSAHTVGAGTTSDVDDAGQTGLAAGDQDEKTAIYWTELRDKAMGFDPENQERLAAGKAPVRFNPVLGAHEEMLPPDGDNDARWPTVAVDPFADLEPAAIAETDAETPNAGENLAETETGQSGDASPDEHPAPDDESESAAERAVRHLERLPEAG